MSLLFVVVPQSIISIFYYQFSSQQNLPSVLCYCWFGNRRASCM